VCELKGVEYTDRKAKEAAAAAAAEQARREGEAAAAARDARMQDWTEEEVRLLQKALNKHPQARGPDVPCSPYAIRAKQDRASSQLICRNASRRAERLRQRGSAARSPGAASPTDTPHSASVSHSWSLVHSCQGGATCPIPRAK
jgi:hypothetical protein